MEEFDTIITGAGISMANPSNLPSGIALAKSLWKELFSTCENERIKEICEYAEEFLFSQEKKTKRKGLRLEGMCDVLSRYIPFHEVRKIYRMVGTTEYNFNHAALVRLYPKGQITLNLDTLLEAAGKLYVTAAPFHLHGIWNQSDTIITTIGQYLGGLPSKAFEYLSTALHQKRVLVLGYSGADLDVFPLFKQFPPAYIEWIRYYNDEFEPEVADWKARLDEENPNSLCVKVTSAQEYLYEALKENDLLDDRLESLYLESSTKSDSTPEVLDFLFNSIQPYERLLGISAILLEIGMCEEAVEVLEVIPDRETHVVMIRDKLMARAYKRMRDYDMALNLLTHSKGQIIPIYKIWQNATEIVSLLPHLQRKSRIAYIVNSTMVFGYGLFRRIPKCRKTEYLARVRRAKLNIFSGRLKRALRDFRFLNQYSENELMKLVGVGSFVDAVSWRADILKMMGKYAEALGILRDIENTVSVYSNVNQHAFVCYKLAETCLLAGKSEEEAFINLERANAYLHLNSDGGTRDKKNGLLPIWVLSAYGDIYSRRYATRVQEALSQAQAYINLEGDRYGGTIYYLLHKAEHARIEKNYSLCISLIEKIIELERDKNLLPRGYRSEKAMAYHIMGMCICDRDKAEGKITSRDGIQCLRKALVCYQKMGMQSGMARVNISIAATLGKSIPTVIIDELQNNNWLLEAEREKNPVKHRSNGLVILV